MSAPRRLTGDMQDEMQDARDRGWTREEIADAFGCSAASVDAYTTPALKHERLTKRQRSRLRLARTWSGVLTVRRVVSHEGEERSNTRWAVRHALKRLVRRGYLECPGLGLLTDTQRRAVLEESTHERTMVFCLTPKGARAARDTVRRARVAA